MAKSTHIRCVYALKKMTLQCFKVTLTAAMGPFLFYSVHIIIIIISLLFIILKLTVVNLYKRKKYNSAIIICERSNRI